MGFVKGSNKGLFLGEKETIGKSEGESKQRLARKCWVERIVHFWELKCKSSVVR